jgi:hypothetical protein
MCDLENNTLAVLFLGNHVHLLPVGYAYLEKNRFLVLLMDALG